MLRSGVTKVLNLAVISLVSVFSANEICVWSGGVKRTQKCATAGVKDQCNSTF